MAFYNFSKSIYDDSELLKTSFHIDVSLALDDTVKKHIYLNEDKIIEWHSNEDITGKINIELGDVLYDLLKKYNLDTNWDKIENLLEECMKVAKLKYK